MPERRPFPPSPRRRALARQAGLTGASPLLVGAAALGAAAASCAMLARSAATQLGAWIAAACDGGATLAPAGGAPSALAPSALAPSGLAPSALAPSGLAHAVLDIAAPLLGIAAIAAIAIHLAQTRGVWLPRRRIEGAPGVPSGAGPRTRAAAFELLAAAIIGVTAFGWLWMTAPRLAHLFDGLAAPGAQLGAMPAQLGTMPAQAALAVAAFLATIAIAYVALGALDALLRHAAVGRALAMTAEEKREDDRMSAADPRWRARRAELARADRRGSARTGDARASARTGNGRAHDDGAAREARAHDDGGAREAIAASTVLILGDDLAVAIAWDPVRRPTPTRIAAGSGARATQLLAHARRQQLPVHRDAALATALAAGGTAERGGNGGGERGVDEKHWPRLAEIVAAVRAR